MQSGVQLDRVRDLLGHRSVETTEIYAHLAPQDVKEAVDLLTSSSQFGHTDFFGITKNVVSHLKNWRARQDLNL